MSDLRTRILAADDIESTIVDIPQWGTKVMVRTMTARERMETQMAAADQKTGQVDATKLMVLVAIRSACDPETGLPIFTDADYDALLTKSGAAVEKLAMEGMRISGFNQQAADAAGKDS